MPPRRINRDTLKKDVVDRVGKSNYKEIKRHVERSNLRLWGQNRNRLFVENNILFTLYKYLFAKGDNKVKDAISGWQTISNDSLQHNSRQVLKQLGEWGANKIRLGDFHEWNRRTNCFPQTSKVKQPNLSIDAVDFPLIGKRRTSRYSPKWSYKIKGPGVRYIMVNDGRNVIRQIYGGFSPKIQDHSWILDHRREVEQDLNQGVIIGDTDYHNLNQGCVDYLLSPNRKKNPGG